LKEQLLIQNMVRPKLFASNLLGEVKTDHILFVASGAFSNSKPTDLIPEVAYLNYFFDFLVTWSFTH